MALTIKTIPKLKHRPGKYFDKGGLYLQVPERGRKQPRQTRASWLLRYQINGRERYMGLGALADFSLEEARERARKARQLLADGIDPLEHRNSERRARDAEARKSAAIPTFRQAAETYFQVHGPKWKNLKHARQFLSSLKAYAFPRLGALRVDAITTDDVLKALEPVWRRIPDTASRTRGRVENVLSWAIANKYREGPNPARWADNLEHLLPAVTQIKARATNHHAALPYAELPAFMSELRTREGISARALEFTILTAARTGEVTGARWDEIDLRARVWTVPADRIKGGREHRVPLSDAAIALLDGLPRERGNEFVFIGRRAGEGLGHVALGGVLKRMGRTDITPHGFRSTFSDWAHETTAFPNHVIEQALAHTVGNAVERAYRRGDLFDKRRKLMDAWSQYCTANPVEADAKVVALARKAR
jgi:integrase